MKKFHLIIFTLLSVLWLFNGCDKATVVEEGDDSEDTGIYSLTVRDNLVTLKAEKADLGTVLKDLAVKTGIEIDLDPGVKDSISIFFEALSLEEALRRITPNYSLVFNQEEGRNEFRIIRVVIPASSRQPGLEGGPAISEESDLAPESSLDQSADNETEITVEHVEPNYQVPAEAAE